MSEKYNFPRLRDNNSQILGVLTPDCLTLSPISGNSINASWCAVSGADAYIVERDTNSDFSDVTLIYEGKNTEYVDSGLALDTTYYYRVMATKLTYFDSGWITDNATTITPQSNETDFLTFSFLEQSGAATIDDVGHTIDIEVVSGTSTTALVAYFTHSLGATVTVGAVSQISGATPNDFSYVYGINYTVTAEDGVTEQEWLVTVTVAAAAEVSVISIQGYGGRCRVSYQVTGDIPTSFLLERSEDGAAYTVVGTVYQDEPFATWKMAGINRNFYYIDVIGGAPDGKTYKYRISGTESNTITMTGNTYYVKTGGNDGLDGLSDGNAWETVEKAISSAQGVGDLVLFKRGDTFTATSTIYVTSGSGTADNPIVWSAYLSGDLPVIRSNHQYGVFVKDVSYRNFEFLKIFGTASADDYAMYFMCDSVNMAGFKLLNCEVDCSPITGGFGGVFFYNIKGNHSQTHHITDVEIAWNEVHDSDIWAGIRMHDIQSNAHTHNNWCHDNHAGIVNSGGLNHITEYNEVRGGTYGDHSDQWGCKANGQAYPLENMIYRRNLVYYCGNHCLALQDSKNGLVEYNTTYTRAALGSFYITAENRPQDLEGNVIENNIFVGSAAGHAALRIELDHVGEDWAEKHDWDYNLLWENLGAIVKYITPTSSIDNHTEWLAEWQPNHLNDIHADPLFNDEVNADFALQSGSPAKDMGVYGAGYSAPPTVNYYGTNRAINGKFISWEAGEPSNWRLINEDANNTITFADPGCTLDSDGSAVLYVAQDLILTIGKTYYITFDILSIDTTLSVRVLDTAPNMTSFTTTGSKEWTVTAEYTTLYFYLDNVAGSATIDNVVVREVLPSPIINVNTGFEDGTWTNEWAEHGDNTPEVIIEIKSTPVNSGLYSLGIYHTETRAEITLIDEPLGRFMWGDEYWLGIAIYLEDWNTNPSAWNSFVQTHTVPQYGDWATVSGLNGWTLHTYDDVLHFHAESLTEAQALNDIPFTGGIGTSAWSIPCPENQQLNFVINWKHSYGTDGFIKLWYNGSLVVDLSGPNIHYKDCDGDPREERCGLQTGSYKSGSNARQLYLDDLKIAGDQATYEDVEPPASTTPNLGAEKLDNPGFDTDTIWEKDAGWTIAGGVGVATATTGRIFQLFAWEGAKNRRTVLDIVVTSGSVIVRDSNGHSSATITSTQTLVWDNIWGNNFVIEGVAGDPFTGTVDNASLREIL